MSDASSIEPSVRTTSRPRRSRGSSLNAHGEPAVWLMGSALAAAVLMIFGLLGLILYEGGRTFWPGEIVQLRTEQGALLGEETGYETYVPDELVLSSLEDAVATRLREASASSEEGTIGRRLLRTENFELTGTHFQWVEEALLIEEQRPEWAVCLERREHSYFYGYPEAFLLGEEEVASGPEATWEELQRRLPKVSERRAEARSLEREDLGKANTQMEAARLELREVELRHGLDSPEWSAEKERHDRQMANAQAEFDRVNEQIRALHERNDLARLRMRTEDGMVTEVEVADIVRANPTNQLGLLGKAGIYLDRWWEFLSTNPRQANSAGGVWPAIFGTVVMTMLMTLIVVPFGVLAALYLREYAKQGILVSVVRIAVNNLAGVPSIVFGVFGVGFFCHVIGVRVDELFFAAELPNPTYGKGGMLWASLTLALLTLPVVIVATEEALSAVPNSMREGSYACGATKWQTIRRIVLPRAQPGIMTGMILAVARGAGEVAPLMLVGAAKYAPELVVDLSQAPYVFPERSFMHLGFHIYDVGFQSQNSEAARPLVYTTTLLLIGIVVTLNLVAIQIRSRLRRKFKAAR